MEIYENFYRLGLQKGKQLQKTERFINICI